MLSELFTTQPEEEIMSDTRQEFILQRREGKEWAIGTQESSERIRVYNVCLFQKKKDCDDAEEEKEWSKRMKEKMSIMMGGKQTEWFRDDKMRTHNGKKKIKRGEGQDKEEGGEDKVKDEK